MSIKALRNLYAGVNPHLNSFLQTRGTREEGPSFWPSFHADHMTHISDELNRILPGNYIARTEQSLQIEWDDLDLGASGQTRSRPDVSIYQTRETSGGAGAAVLELETEPETHTLLDTIDQEADFVPAVIVRQIDGRSIAGRVIARLELLSPTNKAQNKAAYRHARNQTLYSGTVLVEVDYLHESEPMPLRVPRYPNAVKSAAYHIYVNNPRPSLEDGTLTNYAFGVHQMLPTIRLPLAGEEFINFDLDPVYQHTFRAGRWGNYLSYDEYPIRFETYSPTDQSRILQRMALIARAAAEGFDLETVELSAI
jgi:uncharacterized protein YkuJ